MVRGGGLLGIHLPKITTLSLNNCVKCNFDILHTLSVCYTYFKLEKRERERQTERERERDGPEFKGPPDAIAKPSDQ